MELSSAFRLMSSFERRGVSGPEMAAVHLDSQLFETYLANNTRYRRILIPLTNILTSTPYS